MCAIGVSSIALATMVLTATDVRSANNNWCAIYTKPENENCTLATFEQCQAQVWGLGGWCRPNPFPNTGVRDRLDLVQATAPSYHGSSWKRRRLHNASIAPRASSTGRSPPSSCSRTSTRSWGRKAPSKPI
jgi:Protein of unknown function (DUF3551)